MIRWPPNSELEEEVSSDPWWPGMNTPPQTNADTDDIDDEQKKKSQSEADGDVTSALATHKFIAPAVVIPPNVQEAYKFSNILVHIAVEQMVVKFTVNLQWVECIM